jgi:hypothetical protein
MDVSGQLHAPAALLQGNNCARNLISLSVSPGAIEERKISCFCQESNPDSTVVQPLAYSLQQLLRLAVP